jgi:cobalt-precorrin 5A hydrolase
MPDTLDKLNSELPTLYITPQKIQNTALQIHPQQITLGLGMNRNTPKEEIQRAVDRFLYEHGLEFSQVSKLASFEAKADEIGLLEYAKEQNLPLMFFSADDINTLTQDFSPSQATKFFNIKGVAEQASLLASEQKTLFLSKRIYGGVTVGASF